MAGYDTVWYRYLIAPQHINGPPPKQGQQRERMLPNPSILACADGRGPATEATGPSATLRFSHIALMTEL